MENKKDVCVKAVKKAKEELGKEQVDRIKSMVKLTLEEMEKEKNLIEASQKRLKILKADLKDMEQGKLDLILERQEKDSLAKKVSKVNVSLIINIIQRNPYDIHYYIPPYIPLYIPSPMIAPVSPSWAGLTTGNATSSSCFVSKDQESIKGGVCNNVESSMESLKEIPSNPDFSKAIFESVGMEVKSLIQGTYQVGEDKSYFVGKGY